MENNMLKISRIVKVWLIRSLAWANAAIFKLCLSVLFENPLHPAMGRVDCSENLKNLLLQIP